MFTLILAYCAHKRLIQQNKKKSARLSHINYDIVVPNNWESVSCSQPKWKRHSRQPGTLNYSPSHLNHRNWVFAIFLYTLLRQFVSLKMTNRLSFARRSHGLKSITAIFTNNGWLKIKLPTLRHEEERTRESVSKEWWPLGRSDH